VKGASNTYGVIGKFLVNPLQTGVLLTADGGVTFKKILSDVNTTCRYGAFPSPKVWYLSAGQWPEKEPPKMEPSVRRLSEMFTILTQTDENGINSYIVDVHPQPEIARNDPDPNPQPWEMYEAAITKTEDGGQTWRTTFYQHDVFYFNGISCPTETSCWAVGESQSGVRPGIRIWHTGNGGQSWEEQLFNSTVGFGLFDIVMQNTNEGWACGGFIGAVRFVAHYWHTTNGGRTWTLETVPGAYCNYFSFVGRPGSLRAVSTVFLSSQQGGVVIYE